MNDYKNMFRPCRLVFCLVSNDEKPYTLYVSFSIKKDARGVVLLHLHANALRFCLFQLTFFLIENITCRR